MSKQQKKNIPETRTKLLVRILALIMGLLIAGGGLATLLTVLFWEGHVH